MNFLGPVQSLVQALHGGDEPRHVAAGFAIGAAWGLVPKGNLFGVAFLLLFFFIRLDKGMALLSAVLFTAIGYGIDPAAHAVGRALLTAGALRGLWTFLYDLPIVPLTRFNNTVVLGNLVIGLVLYWPLYAVFLRLVHAYRDRYAQHVEKLRVVQAFKGLGWYQTYRRWTSK